MKARIIHGLLLLLIAGAVNAQSEPATQPPIQPSVLQQQQLTFIDSKLFDVKLSKELESGKNRVEVEITGRVTLSNIPARIDKWVTKVGEEGKVEVKQSEPTPRTRAIFGLIPMVFSAFKQMREERLFDPASNYDATIFYKKDAAGETLIEKVVFTRR